MKGEMAAYKKAYALMALALVLWVVCWFVEADGAEYLGRVGFLLVAIGAGAFGIVGQFGSARASQWVERSF